MAEFDIEKLSRNVAEDVMNAKISSDGTTMRELIRKYRAGDLVEAVRCVDCEKAGCCPIGRQPIAIKTACVDGTRKQKG